jgi:hypothetical protein
MAALRINVKHRIGQRLPHSMRCLPSCAPERHTNMPRFYFHLSTPDEDFPDIIGSDVSDLVDAHSRAVLLAKRVTMLSRFADHAPDFRRWTVNVTDERQRPVFTVIFPTNSVPRGIVGGARALLMRLDALDPQPGINGAARLLPTRRSRTNSICVFISRHRRHRGSEFGRSPLAPKIVRTQPK